MSYIYKYNKEYQTLQQFDECGILRSSMSMPRLDLYKISRLDSKINVERSIEELKSIVLENINQVVESCDSNEKDKYLDTKLETDV